MTSIDVDFDVFKALTAKRAHEGVSYNDVLREVLKLGPAQAAAKANGAGPSTDWVTKGVRFPAGTEFRAKYKGETYSAIVRDGALVLNGKRYTSPSAAAVSITSGSVNGWRFWECRMPGATGWRAIVGMKD